MHGFFLVFIGLWLGCTALHGQGPRPLPVHYYPGNGLPEKELYDILQTPDGLMYIASETGLYRFDGVAFRHISMDATQGVAVSALQLGRNGRLWCRNFNKQVFYLERDTLRLFRTFEKVNSVFAFMRVDSLGRLAVARRDSLLLFPAPLSQPDWYLSAPIPGPGVADISPFLNNTIYVSLEHKNCVRYFLTEAGIQWEVIEMLPSPRQFVLRQDSMWASFDASFYRGENKLVKLSEASPHASISLKMLPAKKRQLQINGSANGQLRISSRAGAFLLRRTGQHGLELEQHLLPKHAVTQIYTDRDGHLWITTLDAGLFFFPNARPDYIPLKNALPVAERPQISALTSLGEDLVVGYENGELFRINLQTGEKRRLHAIENRMSAYSRKFRLKKLSSSEGRLLLLKGDVSLAKSDGSAVQTYWAGFIRDYSLHEQRLYTSSQDGIYEFDLTAQVDVNNISRWRTRLDSGVTRLVAYSEIDDGVYFKTPEGLRFLKDGRKRTLVIDAAPFLCTSLESHAGRVYAAGQNGRIVELRNGREHGQVAWPHNLPPEPIRSLHASGGRLLIQTANHLLLLEDSTQTLRALSLPPDIVPSAITALHANTHGLYLGLPTGIVWIKAPFSSTRARPEMSLLRVFGSDANYRIADKISHPYTAGAIHLQLQGLHYMSGQHLTYRYRLVGVNDNWRSLRGSATKITFEQLPPGSYTFEAEAISRTGEVSKRVVQRIVITRPFWMSWWFYALLTLIGLGIISLLYLWRLRYIQKRAREREELVASQMKALRAQMNPHFIFNALSSIQDLILQQDTRQSIFYLGKFSGLMRRVLEASELERISLQKELELLENYIELEALRFERDFVWRIEVDDSIDAEECHIPPMILQPFVENAIKHGLLHKTGERELHLQFDQAEAGILRCCITDNGIGRKVARAIQARQPHRQSFSTSAIQERLQLMQDVERTTIGLSYEDLQQNARPSGTRIILKVPYESL